MPVKIINITLNGWIVLQKANVTSVLFVGTIIPVFKYAYIGRAVQKLSLLCA